MIPGSVSSTFVLGVMPMSLTPVERWQAARRFTLDLSAESWMLVIGLTALAGLIIIFWWVTYRASRQERRKDSQFFLEAARRRGLSTREFQLLSVIAGLAGLKRPGSIFTMKKAFTVGAARLMEEGLGGQPTAESIEQLRTEVSFLREKLGFSRKRPLIRRPTAAVADGLNSRQIPVGKRVHLTRREAQTSSDIVAVVVRNSDTELALKLLGPVKVTFGETWCVRYHSGVSVWEFDTKVASYDGDTLVLSHSDRVRFVNRRRFLRVQVRMHAFVAKFPFARPVSVAGQDGAEPPEGNDTGRQGHVVTWGPPEFVPAVVTELAGPGLRFDSNLAVEVGDRLILVFGLRQPGQPDAGPQAVRIIQDIAEVRHVSAGPSGYSAAVELMGLSDSDVEELIRATNAVLAKVRMQEDQGGGEAGEPQSSSEATVSQGVQDV